MTYLPAHLEPYRALIPLQHTATIEEALRIPAALSIAPRFRREQALVNAQIELLERLHRAGLLVSPASKEIAP